jgi:phage FluMu protein Com
MSQLITCTECKKHLQVPDELMGKKVQCPECKHTFTAEESTPTEAVSSTGTTASKPSKSTTPKKAEWDKDEDEEDTSSRKSKTPKKKPRADDDEDDDDDDDDERRRRRRSNYGGSDSRYAPHRGGMILAFGIISLAMFAVFAPLALIFGPIAWIMGNADMAEIRAGRMDPTGESQVQTGRILGLISTLICVVSLLLGFGVCCLIMIAGGMQPQRG